jgi:hypothetical protein
LALDHLAIVASSVSSERAFSSAGITITKRRNRLRGDIVEALQVLKASKRGGISKASDSLSLAKETELEKIEESEYELLDGIQAASTSSAIDEHGAMVVPNDDCYE